MTKSYSFKRHFFCLSALFYLGEGVLLLPTGASVKTTILGYILSGLIAFSIFFAAVPVANVIFKTKAESLIKRIFCCTVLITVAVAALFCAANCFKAFFRFATALLLPKSPRFIVILIFAVVVLYLTLKPKSVYLKFSLIAFFTVSVTVFALFIICASNFNLENLYIYSLPDINGLLDSTMQYLRITALPVLLLPFFEAAVLDGSHLRSQLGANLGFILLGLCILTPILIFSLPLAGEFSYPYSAAVSTASLGRLFTRADGFVYIIYFITATVKTITCIIIATHSLKRINEILK